MGSAKGRGRAAALPKAGMNWLRAIRRIHEQMMPRVDMISMKAVEDCFNGLMRHYQLKWTVAATLPRRKEPLTNADSKVDRSMVEPDQQREETRAADYRSRV